MACQLVDLLDVVLSSGSTSSYVDPGRSGVPSFRKGFLHAKLHPQCPESGTIWVSLLSMGEASPS